MEIIQCVGVICFKEDEVLLIRRAVPPRAGEWSIPGGRIEPGETEQQAALRELLEETSITAKLGPKIELVVAEFDGKIYHLHDYAAQWLSGQPTPNEEVWETRFVPLAQITTYGMWDRTVDVISKGRRMINKK